MKKKNLFLFLVILIVGIFGAYWFYKFASWYEQTLGALFAYIVIISFLMLIFAPFKLIKDKKGTISVLAYFKFMGITLLNIAKVIGLIAKESVLTLVFIFSRFFSKKTKGVIKETIE
ncbi:hypothetical protein FLM55_03110 [Francisella sp. Scap27]|uniref:hypothetical protein n=1 Tax=Francisella sp. Scap27 TaxID=2589986 RepID=UPI0015B8898C|nr:hypothetical protein [Francisella sp. Scap27]QLE78782.1 hypothetical protein FLM55_03110 [Francisella sp. Scap27]